MTKPIRRKAVVAAALLLVLSASPAFAVNWVRVFSDPEGDPSFTEVDSDSIRRGSDGLVYFDAQDDMGISPSAVDCAKQFYYVVGNGTLDYMADPYPIKPGTEPAKEADFVCSRV